MVVFMFSMEHLNWDEEDELSIGGDGGENLQTGTVTKNLQ